MSSIFTKIVNGEIPCYKVAEEEQFLAFLDVNPNAVGHTLCIPKQEIDKLFVNGDLIVENWYKKNTNSILRLLFVFKYMKKRFYKFC